MKNLYITSLLLLSVLGVSYSQNIVHLSDLHVDLDYKVGSAANCYIGTSTGMKCCRWYDIPKKPYRKAKKWGDFDCDTTTVLTQFAVDWVNKTYPEGGLLLWTGDSASHHILLQTFEKNMKVVDTCTGQLYRTLDQSKWKIIPVIGNHDTWPIDQLLVPHPFTDVTEHLSNSWKIWLSDDQLETFKKGGYYMMEWNDITFIVVNCLYEDKLNLLDKYHSDPAGQYSWIMYQLKKARSLHKRIWLIGHIPPGTSEATSNFTQMMVDISLEYYDIIENQFWGHTHHDEFRLYYKNGIAVAHAYVTPSVMPDHHDPAIRVYQYDDNYQVTNYQVFTVNLTALNNNEDVTFKEFYDAKKEYQLNNMTAYEWSIFFDKMNDNMTIFKQYFTNYKPGASIPSCNDDCRKGYLCDITHMGSQNPLKC